VVREGVGAGGRNDPSLYAHMNNKRKKIASSVIFYFLKYVSWKM
jgi:hypothetical protein